MWSTIRSYLYAFGGLDDELDLQQSASEPPSSNQTNGSSTDPLKSDGGSPWRKPREPLHFGQIESAWLEFLSICDDVNDCRNFDIESDLKLERPVRIALLDTGVYQEHEALASKVVRVRNFVPRRFQADANEDLTIDSNGHGTFCASLMVGGVIYLNQDVDGASVEPFRNGIAPFAKLAVGKVIDTQRRGDVDWLIKALKWACDIEKLDNRRPVNADIICVPIGMPRYHPDLRNVLYAAQAKGKIIVCSATHGGETESPAVQYPGKFGDVICVGSQSENGQPSGFTPSGRAVDFLGPGENVWSASSRGPGLVKCESDVTVAAAYVTGVCALILAYADILGGVNLRAKVSKTVVMKELLRRMSSQPGHHNPVSGYGNIVPYRLLRYGPQNFAHEVSDLVPPKTTATNKQLRETLGPLQPILSDYSARYVAENIPLDETAIRGLLKGFGHQRVLHHVYRSTFAKLFCVNQEGCMPVTLTQKVLSGDCREIRHIDLSLPDDFDKVLKEKRIDGIDLESVMDMYLGDEELDVDLLTMPNFVHIARLGQDAIFRHINPKTIFLPGKVPLHYALDVLRALPGTAAAGGETVIVCENVDVVFQDGFPEKARRFHQLYLEQIRDRGSGVQIYCRSVNIPNQVLRNTTDSGEVRAEEGDFLSLIRSLSSTGFLDLLLPDTNSGKADRQIQVPRPLFNTELEIPGSIATILQNDLNGELSRELHLEKKFQLWSHLQPLLSSAQNKEKSLKEVLHKAEAVRKAIMKDYEGALHILANSSLAERVSCLDLQMPILRFEDEASSPGCGDVQKGDDAIFPFTASDEVYRTLSRSGTEIQSVVMSGVFRTLSVKSQPSCTIGAIILPPLDRIADLEEVFQCLLWRKCRELKVPGETKLCQLLLILRVLPRGDYPLHVHVERLYVRNALLGEKARDIDTPGGVRIVVHEMVVDKAFFYMSERAVQSIYEVFLVLRSQALLCRIRDECTKFVDDPGKFSCKYNSNVCHNACRKMTRFISEALDEGLVDDGDDILITFSEETFTSIKPSDGGSETETTKVTLPAAAEDIPKEVTIRPVPVGLPRNVYIPYLPNMKEIISALQNDKIKNVTVAILGSGVNALHPEFQTKLAASRVTRRDRGCPFGDSIVGLAYNAYPEESAMSFLDAGSNCHGVGTILAALVAGRSCGAAPFSNVVSVKVSNVEGRTTAAIVSDGLQWLLEQEEKAYLPATDVVLVPFNFSRFNSELYRLVNRLSSAGKVIVCCAGRTDAMDATKPCFPASYGDVLCIGAHGVTGEILGSSGKGREIDLLARGDLDLDTMAHGMPARMTSYIAAAQVAGVVAYIMAYAELTGGASLRQALSNNSAMREILKNMCSRPGHHDDRWGYGTLNPKEVLKHGDTYLRKLASEITEEYYEISTQRIPVKTQKQTTDLPPRVAKFHAPQVPAARQRSTTNARDRHQSAEATPRGRSATFTSEEDFNEQIRRDVLLRQKLSGGRSRTNSETSILPGNCR